MGFTKNWIEIMTKGFIGAYPNDNNAIYNLIDTNGTNVDKSFWKGGPYNYYIFPVIFYNSHLEVGTNNSYPNVRDRNITQVSNIVRINESRYQNKEDEGKLSVVFIGIFNNQGDEDVDIKEFGIIKTGIECLSGSEKFLLYRDLFETPIRIHSGEVKKISVKFEFKIDLKHWSKEFYEGLYKQFLSFTAGDNTFLSSEYSGRNLPIFDFKPRNCINATTTPPSSSSNGYIYPSIMFNRHSSSSVDTSGTGLDLLNVFIVPQKCEDPMTNMSAATYHWEKSDQMLTKFYEYNEALNICNGVIDIAATFKNADEKSVTYDRFLLTCRLDGDGDSLTNNYCPLYVGELDNPITLAPGESTFLNVQLKIKLI